MLFRTKFVAVFASLAIVAIGCASLLILSSQRSALNQTRTTLAYESLSGYLQLSGSIFRTFKQARRDLVSGTGDFAFDLTEAERSISTTLSEIEIASLAEARFARQSISFNDPDQVDSLRRYITEAFLSIRQASETILSGQVDEGRQQAIAVLEGTVDNQISTLIEEAIAAEREQLAAAQEEISFINGWVKRIAWASVIIALGLSMLVLFPLVRRFNTGMGALETGVQAFAADDLKHVISLSGTDELSDLASRFNGMAEQISTKREALETIKQNLEARVAERTTALQGANDELTERDRLRRQFFADIGHELRTPVTAIRGEAEVALRAKQDVETAQRNALGTIVSLSAQLTEGVSDLFLIARAQAGVLDFRAHELCLHDVIADGLDQMSSVVAEAGATLTNNTAGETLLIEGDSNRIRQLVRILISNALTHTQAGVAIKVSTYADDNEAVLAVTDDGPGIPESERPRIFDRYVRGAKDPNRPASGTGLGLAIAKSITLAHGGNISVVGNNERGTRIEARFPLNSADLP